MKKTEASHLAGEDVKMMQQLLNTVWHLLKKLNVKLPYDLEIPLSDLHIYILKSHKDYLLNLKTLSLFCKSSMAKISGAETVCASVYSCF